MPRFKIPAAFSLAFACLLGSSLAHASPIVGSWLLAPVGGPFSTVTFLADGRYLDATTAAGHIGVEWGTYSWDEATGAITATSQGDTNGNTGIAGDVNGVQHFAVSGNTGTMSQVGCPSCTTSFNRILPGASPIVGSWLLEPPSSGIFSAFIFLPGGRYMDAFTKVGDAAHTGVEWGTYSWNSVTGMISATMQGDTNGNWGFWSDPDGPQYITVSGNTGQLFQPGCLECSADLNRILPSAVPEPETFALLLSGLGLLGAFSRRRRSSPV